jgi:hypothetical protein
MQARDLVGWAVLVIGLGCITTKTGTIAPTSGPAHAASSRIALVDGDDAFDTRQAFQRAGDEPSQSCERHYMKSVRTDYIASDWTFRVTFHAPANAPDDIIFVGLGEAVPDKSFFNEPRNSVNFRIHQGATAFGVRWRVDVVAHDTGNFHWTYYNEAVGRLPGPAGGTHTIQIRKDGSGATFEVVDLGIIVTIPDLGKAAPFLYARASRIFFGNACSAYYFERPELFASP